MRDSRSVKMAVGLIAFAPQNNSQHYFYVDTKADPPRSIWSHPLDVCLSCLRSGVNGH